MFIHSTTKDEMLCIRKQINRQLSQIIAKTN